MCVAVISQKHKLVGKSIGFAHEYCQAENLECRVIVNDEKHFVITHDYHPDRLNLEVKEGIVIKITNG